MRVRPQSRGPSSRPVLTSCLPAGSSRVRLSVCTCPSQAAVTRSNVEEKELPEPVFLESQRRRGPAVGVVIERMKARAHLAPRTHLRRVRRVPALMLAPSGGEQVEAASAVGTANDVLHQFVRSVRDYPSLTGPAGRPGKGEPGKGEDVAWPSRGEGARAPQSQARPHRCKAMGTRQGDLSHSTKHYQTTCVVWSAGGRRGNTVNFVFHCGIFLTRCKGFPYGWPGWRRGEPMALRRGSIRSDAAYGVAGRAPRRTGRGVAPGVRVRRSCCGSRTGPARSCCRAGASASGGCGGSRRS